MKAIQSTLMCLILSICFSSVHAQVNDRATQTPQLGRSLMTNGDFQTPNTDNTWPAEWEHDANSPITWLKEEDGNQYLRLVAPFPDMVIAQSRIVDIPENVKGVVFSIRFRVNGFKFGTNASGGVVYSKDMHFNYYFMDATDNVVTKGHGGFVLDSHAKTWRDESRRVLVPEGAVKVKIALVLNQIAAGLLDVAQVGVHAMPAGEAEGIIAAREEAIRKKADDEAAIPQILSLPPKTLSLKVDGNRLVNSNGQTVLLQGVNVPSLEWSAKGENVLRSVKVAIDDWHANVIRLPVHDDFWFGRGKPPKITSNDADAYRKVIDDAIHMVSARGIYLILDLHKYHAPNDNATAFWQDAATRYKNNPAVLFDLLNEPTNISWELWRNGGMVPLKPKDKNAPTEFHSPGMQGLLDTIRATGANNIIIAGGTGYAYNLSGVLEGYALEDKTGNGIIYATHFYNWHRGWESHFLKLADKYPLLVGEFGADIKKMSFIPAKSQEDPYTWMPDALGMIQKYKLNWTAFSLHPKATPVLIQDWDYTPTPFFGEFVKKALGGETFEMQKLR